MTDIYELLICIIGGLILLIFVSVFTGNHLAYIEVPLLRRVPIGLLIAVAVPLYGFLGLITLGLGQLIITEFTLTVSIRIMLGISATLTSYYFGKITMQMFQETPHQPFCDRAIGLRAKIRYKPLAINKPGDALVFDSQEKITQIVTIYLADWVQEKELKVNDPVRIIEYLPQQKAFLIVKANSVDELTWQNSLFHQ